MTTAEKELRKAKRSAERALDEGRKAAEHALEAGHAKVTALVETSYGGAHRSLTGLMNDLGAYLRNRPTVVLGLSWSSGLVIGLCLGARVARAS